MAKVAHAAVLSKGVQTWNCWRQANPAINPDLTGVDVFQQSLVGVDFSNTRLVWANLAGADLSRANLSGSEISEADLFQAQLAEADLRSAKARWTIFAGANLRDANLTAAWLSGANFVGADMRGADLTGANLDKANLTGVNFAGAKLNGCCVYGVSAWDVVLDGAEQNGLVITYPTRPVVTVDSLEVAQFVYLLLNNAKLRSVIDTVTSKVVLILGRFTADRKRILDAIRVELGRRGYVPVVFDFQGPESRDTTETIGALAHMARFVIVDLTDPKSVPHELASIVPTLSVPVQPLILDEGDGPYSMFWDLRKYPWVLPVFRYKDIAVLLRSVGTHVITPAESKATEIGQQRKQIAAEMIRRQVGDVESERAYDSAKSSGEHPVPLEQAIEEIDSERLQESGDADE